VSKTVPEGFAGSSHEGSRCPVSLPTSDFADRAARCRLQVRSVSGAMASLKPVSLAENPNFGAIMLNPFVDDVG